MLVVHQRPGRDAVELTPLISSIRYTTNAVGGFGSCDFTVPGDRRRDLSYLGLILVLDGTVLIWEGQLEDVGVQLAPEVATTVRAFGLRRKLEETSTRRIWSRRDIDWIDAPGGLGADIDGGFAKADLSVALGNFDSADLTRAGVSFAGNGVAVAANAGRGANHNVSTGLTIARLMATLTLSGANTGVGKMKGTVVWRSGGAWAAGTVFTASQAVDQALTGTPTVIQLEFYTNDAITPISSDICQWENIRLLGTALIEDAAGGFYGGTILRDLISLVPGLTVGLVEDGSDFTIQALARATRDNALSVLNEVAGYYTREWAVWEDGRFDWKTRNLGEPQWIVEISSLDALELDSSVDDIGRTAYVLYTDAASGVDAEASSVATDQLNPYVRQALTKDYLLSPGFPMTSNTSAQLASRVAGDIGKRPSISGRLTLPATALVPNAVGIAAPATRIRGGDNILLTGVPVTDPFKTGRDGETLFHVASSEVDLGQQRVTLELEGQQRRTDVLIARLAAVTRTLTG